MNKTNVKGHSKTTKALYQDFLLLFCEILSCGFLCLQWVSKRGKRASVTISWVALHSPHSRPTLQPAQTWAAAPDVTGAFLLCCRWDLAPVVLEYMIALSSTWCFTETVLMQTQLLVLWKADVSYNLTPTICTPEGTMLKWHQEINLLLFRLVKIGRSEGVRL